MNRLIQAHPRARAPRVAAIGAVLLAALLTATGGPPASAQSGAAISRGVAWLAQGRNELGGWGDARSPHDTALVARALARSQPGGTSLASALAYLRNRPAERGATTDLAAITLAFAEARQRHWGATFGAALRAAQNAPDDGPIAAPAIFLDAFAQDDGTWAPSSAVNCRREYKDGGFLLTISPNAFGTACWYLRDASLGDLDVEVLARPADLKGKTLGIAFRQQRDSTPATSPYGLDDRLYRFEINPASGQYALILQNGRTITRLIDWTAAPAILTGQQPNRLRVTARGSTITLYANGTRLATKDDATLKAGNVGMLVTAIDTTFNSGGAVSFDNLVLYRSRVLAEVRPNGVDGGWGLRSGYASDPWHTALALEAMNQSGAVGRNEAAAYLIAAQLPDGSWGGARGAPTSLTVTAQALLALAGSGADGAGPAITRGVQYLRGRQNADGGWGAAGSSVSETALALRALRGGGLSAQATTSAEQFLLGRQAANGSWNNSPSETAAALLALTREPPPYNRQFLPLLRR